MYKKISLILCLLIISLLILPVYGENNSYEVLFKGYTPGNGTGLLTWVTWERIVKVDNQICPLNEKIPVSNLNCIITITGKDNKGVVYFEGNYEGTLNEGPNKINIVINRIKYYRGSKSTYLSDISIDISNITPLPTESILPSETPTPSVSESVTPSGVIEDTPTYVPDNTPTPSIIENIVHNDKELPKTGETSSFIFIISGSLLTIIGGSGLYIRNRKKAKG